MCVRERDGQTGKNTDWQKKKIRGLEKERLAVTDQETDIDEGQGKGEYRQKKEKRKEKTTWEKKLRIEASGGSWRLGADERESRKWLSIFGVTRGDGLTVAGNVVHISIISKTHSDCGFTSGERSVTVEKARVHRQQSACIHAHVHKQAHTCTHVYNTQTRHTSKLQLR